MRRTALRGQAGLIAKVVGRCSRLPLAEFSQLLSLPLAELSQQVVSLAGLVLVIQRPELVGVLPLQSIDRFLVFLFGPRRKVKARPEPQGEPRR